jgi:hypothetical protein
MRRLYADKLVVIAAVLIVLFSALFALVQSSARRAYPADKMPRRMQLHDDVRHEAAPGDPVTERDVPYQHSRTLAVQPRRHGQERCRPA